METPKILLVDDENDFAELAKLTLESLGCEVHVSLGGSRALAMAKSEKPHLIITDMFMPDMNGIEVLRQIKNDPDTVDTPIIFCTSSQKRDQISDAFQGGAIYYIPKPVSPDQLKAKVKNILNIMM